MLPIHLDAHAVIEASAGTGKTFTIERIVHRLLLERRARLEQILLVTFTEKATAELKERLRNLLEKEAGVPEHRALLLPALDQFDQAPIFTIHGFCQRLLSEYALEQGHDFGPTLAQDGDLIEPCLREVQRRVWRQTFGDQLPRALAAAKYQLDQVSNFENPLRALARNFRPEAGHRLLPELRSNWPACDLALDPMPKDFDQQLQVFTLGHLLTEIAAAKSARGLHSFDDMIARVAHGLDPARNPAAPHLLETLRRRFRYAIVDEFQDTDPLQWDIFRRLFLEGGATKLFVVGDPKQAIFAFRNADLPTYQAAVRDMEGRFGAQKKPLTTNWRSCPELLDGLNRLFRQADHSWFDYHDVQAPDPAERRTTLEHDPTGRPALALVDLRTQAAIVRPGQQPDKPSMPPNGKPAGKEFAWFVAREISRLLAQPPRFRQKKAEKTLGAEDICVLVFKHAEAKPLIRALREYRIPFTYYKQRGLWTSAEAKQLRLLVQALADPEDHGPWHKLLLTPLFGVTPAELETANDHGMAAAAGDSLKEAKSENLRAQWQFLALRRRWGPLFQSVLEDTGVLRRGREEPDYERRLANYRHIAAHLARTAYRDNLDVHGLLDRLRQGQALDESQEADVQPIETDRAKVQIMTVHASKGLEFPVVFLAGGFTGSPNRDPYSSYRDPDGRKVWNLDKEAGKKNQKTEVDGELRRLLYVALTRAMVKLYVPWQAKPSRGAPGPLAVHLGPLLESAQLESLGLATAQVIGLRSNQDAPRLTAASKTSSPARPLASYLQNNLPADLENRRLEIQSFSSLQRQAYQESVAHFGEVRQRRDDDLPDALAQENPLRGTVFGQLVHDFLENVDFAAVGQAAASEWCQAGAPARRLLDDLLAKYVPSWPSRWPRVRLEAEARTLVADLAHAALRTILPSLGLPLYAIPKKDRIHEMEFLFPTQGPIADLEEVEAKEGFLTGFIDLVFRHQGQYYLLDWKTNLLDGYGPADLAAAMDHSGYHRQYRLYLQALDRWLGTTATGQARGHDRFGGVYYLFLRGMKPPAETSGIFFHQPTAADLDLNAVLS